AYSLLEAIAGQRGFAGMPTDDKADFEEAASAGQTRLRRAAGPWASVPGPVARRLRMPVTGMEAEFNVFLDGLEIDPRAFWGRPTGFIDVPMLRREKSSFQLPTGGAVYFDRGVIEVVTPVIELAPGCSARVVRNLWEQIAFVRRELSKWEKRIVREVMTWPSYDVSLLDRRPIPTVEGVVPGKHTTRKGWLTKDFHFPQSPFTSDMDAPIWKVRGGHGLLSLRDIALRTAWYFRRSIRRYADPFSFRMLFSILKGGAPSLLELDDRPSAYEDVGRLCRWGMVLPALRGFETRRRPSTARQVVWNVGTLDDFIAA